MSSSLSLRAYIILLIGLLFLFITTVTIVLVNSNMREQAILEAQAKARLLLDCNLATHTYFSKDLKPSLFNTLKPFTNKDYFDPIWMSSTYAVSKMQNYFRHFNSEPYFYKEASVDARSSHNEADDYERTFLGELQNNGKLTQKSAIRSFDGKPYLTVMRRGEEMDPSCLRCHSTPDQAPGDLVAQYGPEKSFNRNAHDVVQAISIRIPLFAAYGNADYFSLKLSGFLIAAFAACFSILFVFLKSYLVTPIDAITNKAVLIADNPELLGDQIERPKGKELGLLVDAFNKMSANVRKSHENLEEQVQLRTAELLRSQDLLRHEIVERKKAESGLRDSETTLRTLLDTAPVGVGLVTDRKFEWTNKTLHEMTGYESDELHGQSSRILYPDESEFERVGLLKYREIQRTGKGQIQTRFLTKTGNLIDILLKSSAVNTSRLSEGVVFTAMDITELQNAQVALRENEAKYRLLTENMKDVIWSLSPDLEYEYVSPSIKNQLGYEADEVTGKKFSIFVTPAFCAEIEENFQKRILSFVKNRDLSSMTFILEQTKKDGSLIWNEIVATPIVDESGKLSGFQGVSRDITDRRRAEQEKIEIERQLLHSQKLESLGILSGGIAHDFNNLLTVVMGNLQIALQDIDPDSSAKHFLESSLKAARKSADLSRQMLAYSGKGVFEVTNVNLRDIVIQNSQIFRSAIPKTINLELDLDDDTPDVRADSGQIQQIIMNLITNAAEALEGKSGTIRLSTGQKYCDKDFLSRSALPVKPLPQIMAYVEVTDNGCGMDPAIMDRIFDPFFTTKFTGRGLGMSVIHGIVRAHEGAIIVDSNEGSGTTIAVCLPVSGEITPTTVMPSTPNKDGNKADHFRFPHSVLIVDDEPAVNDLMRKILTSIGLNTVSAFNGKQALDIFSQNPDSFDIVIVDLTMPEMDGVETFKRISAIKHDIRVVMCSGYDEHAIIRKFDQDERPNAFLKKPYDNELLKGLIRDLS